MTAHSPLTTDTYISLVPVRSAPRSLVRVTSSTSRRQLRKVLGRSM